jgi:glycosyltransferase involved in cell wall biosynthesis
MSTPRVLFVSDKRLFRWEGRYFTDGQTPLQLKAFSEVFDLHVASPIAPAQTSPTSLSPIDGAIGFHSLGDLRYFLSIPQPWVKRQVLDIVPCLIREIRPDVVIAKYPREVGVYGVLAAAQLGVPTILSYDYDWFADISVRVSRYPRILVGWYEKWITGYRLKMTKLAGKTATRLTTVSRAFACQLSEICRRDIAVLSNAYSLSETLFSLPSPSQSVRFRLIYVGRVDRNKNLETLLHAIDVVRKAYPAVNLTIVGDGPCLPRLRELAHSLALDGTVRFSGYVRNGDLPQLLDSAGILVLPSFSEALGQVLLEAMAAGRPVIGSNTGGIPELIRDGDNGILIDPHMPTSLANAISQVMGNWDEAVRMGARGRQLAEQFKPARVNQRWIEMVGSVLSSSSA